MIVIIFTNLHMHSIFSAYLREKVIFYVDYHLKNLGNLFKLHIQALSFYNFMFGKFLHCKKRLSIFPSPAGMSLTKLSVAGNNLIIPGHGE